MGKVTNVLTPKDISNLLKCKRGLDISTEAIKQMGEKLGCSAKHRAGNKVGYHKSFCDLLVRHLYELVQLDKELKKENPKRVNVQPKGRHNGEPNYYAYNGERDNIDYEWEKNENTIKESNMENLTVLWLDDQRDPYKYLNTKSKSATFARNKQFYDNLLKQYNANFVWVKNIYQFIDYIEKNGVPQFVSFDHDLNNRGGGEGLSDEQKLNNNGVNCAKWLVNYCKQVGEPLPKFYVHSANPKHGPEINRVLTSENKQIIRVTEQELHKIIRESINEILKKNYGIIY